MKLLFFLYLSTHIIVISFLHFWIILVLFEELYDGRGSESEARSPLIVGVRLLTNTNTIRDLYSAILQLVQER